jgi:hypothetical protein
MKALTVTSASVLALAVATGAQQLSFDINRISDTGVGEKIGTANSDGLTCFIRSAVLRPRRDRRPPPAIRRRLHAHGSRAGPWASL